MLRIEVVFVLCVASLVYLFKLRSAKRVNHTEFLLLDAADPLPIRHYRISDFAFVDL